MIEVSHLVKEFKIPVQKKGRFAAVRNLFSSEHTIKRAVDDITFSVDDGEIVGFIGKNGAGKSTTIKMLSGILQPTSGNVTVDGIKPFEQRMENAKQIGVVFGQKTQLWWDVPLIESYRLLKEIYKIEDGTYRKNLDRYIPMLDLEEVINKPVRQMSLGQRVKADICAALLHDPTGVHTRRSGEYTIKVINRITGDVLKVPLSIVDTKDPQVEWNDYIPQILVGCSITADIFVKNAVDDAGIGKIYFYSEEGGRQSSFTPQSEGTYSVSVVVQDINNRKVSKEVSICAIQ